MSRKRTLNRTQAAPKKAKAAPKKEASKGLFSAKKAAPKK